MIPSRFRTFPRKVNLSDMKLIHAECLFIPESQLYENSCDESASGISDHFSLLIRSIFNCFLHRQLTQSVSHLEVSGWAGGVCVCVRERECVCVCVLTLTLPRITRP